MANRSKQFACGCVGFWNPDTKHFVEVTCCSAHTTTHDLVRVVLDVERVCKGPYVLDAEQNALRAEWDRLEALNNWNTAHAFLTALTLRLNQSAAEVRAGDWDALFGRVLSLLYLHKNDCGYDFNETILARSFDGEEHDYTCPKCGVAGTYRAPRP